MPRRPATALVIHTPMPPIRIIAVLVAGLFVAAMAMGVAPPVRAAGGDGLREGANGYRQSHGRAPVFGTALLDDIASRRAARMAQQDNLQHDMDYVGKRLNDAGVCWSGFGEIIAWENYPDYSPDHALAMWWDSPPHHDIMLGDGYNAAGGAWDTAADGGHYSVMVFVTLCGQSTAVRPGGNLHPDDRYDPTRALVLRAGRQTAYRLGRSGEVMAQRSVRLSKTVRARSAGRARVHGKAWLKVRSGALAGYWVHETTNSFVRGLTQCDRFDVARNVTLERGRYLGMRFDWLGRVKARHARAFGHQRTVSTAARAVINGRHYAMLSSGPLSGYWVRDTPRVHPA
ncbi:MAG TPA: CAP domain-containing protein [Candidatus Limnocylindria bacterium]